MHIYYIAARKEQGEVRINWILSGQTSCKRFCFFFKWRIIYIRGNYWYYYVRAANDFPFSDHHVRKPVIIHACAATTFFGVFRATLMHGDGSGRGETTLHILMPNHG